MKKGKNKTYLNNIKYFLMSNYERFIYFLCLTIGGCCFVIMVCKNQSKTEKIKRISNEKNEWIKSYKNLQKEHLLLLENHVGVVDEVKRLQNENNIFGSLLGEIETTPRGKNLIKNLNKK
tara:strand:+ start:530 stop:889 length:360 start_codon:yes stop_codon:yes gene_type:complete